MTDTITVDNYFVSLVLNEKNIFLSATDTAFTIYEGAVEPADLRQNKVYFELAEVYGVLRNCLERSQTYYGVSIRKDRGCLKIAFDGMVGGIIKFAYSLSLTEKTSSINEVSVLKTIDNLRAEVAELKTTIYNMETKHKDEMRNMREIMDNIEICVSEGKVMPIRTYQMELDFNVGPHKSNTPRYSLWLQSFYLLEELSLSNWGDIDIKSGNASLTKLSVNNLRMNKCYPDAFPSFIKKWNKTLFPNLKTICISSRYINTEFDWQQTQKFNDKFDTNIQTIYINSPGKQNNCMRTAIDAIRELCVANNIKLNVKYEC